ncbi:outer membrane beta-barrel protein [Aquiflexum lacus]|uniref:outer membrane beta-barrel protein n=1 Tax=Aquiflexum lacus TaxID=2483805 RepID=UPI001894F176|nr:outer membrane beta-barrel protein [Aquiflexum lacus]
MKKFIYTTVVLLFMGYNAMAQFSLRPQVGIQFSNLTYEAVEGQINSQNGLSFGADVQIGGTLFVQPGLMVTPVKMEIDNVGDIAITKLNVPVMVGFKLFEPDGGRAFGMRVFAGPNFAFNVNDTISEAITSVTTDDLNNFQLSAIGGIGFDLSILFIDFAYKYGISETISPRNGVGAGLNAFMINAGIRIGF